MQNSTLESSSHTIHAPLITGVSNKALLMFSRKNEVSHEYVAYV